MPRTHTVSTLNAYLASAGKSTLLRLMVRLYDANEGSIRLNGTDVRYLAHPYLSFLRTKFIAVLLWSVKKRKVTL